MSATVETATANDPVIKLDEELTGHLAELAREHEMSLEQYVLRMLRHHVGLAALRQLQEAYAGVAEEMGLSEEDIISGNY